MYVCMYHMCVHHVCSTYYIYMHTYIYMYIYMYIHTYIVHACIYGLFTAAVLNNLNCMYSLFTQEHCVYVQKRTQSQPTRLMTLDLHGYSVT